MFNNNIRLRAYVPLVKNVEFCTFLLLLLVAAAAVAENNTNLHSVLMEREKKKTWNLN